MNDNINMDSTIAGSMNDNINMDSTIAGSVSARIVNWLLSRKVESVGLDCKLINTFTQNININNSKMTVSWLIVILEFDIY